MKRKTLLICILVSISSLSYGLDNDINKIEQVIKRSKSIDELIVKMNQSEYKYRYKFMNAIKHQLSSTKQKDRTQIIQKVLSKIEKGKEDLKGTNNSSFTNGFQNNTQSNDGMSSAGSMGGIGGSGESMGGMGGSGGSGGEKGRW